MNNFFLFGFRVGVSLLTSVLAHRGAGGLQGVSGLGPCISRPPDPVRIKNVFGQRIPKYMMDIKNNMKKSNKGVYEKHFHEPCQVNNYCPLSRECDSGDV